MSRLLRTVAFTSVFFIGALAVTLVFAATLFGIPVVDLPAIASLLLVVGGGSSMLALLLLQPTVLGRIGGVRGQLVGVGLIGGLLLVVMVLAGAQAMFISAHDLAVLLTMVLFAGLLAVGFSLRGAAPLSKRIERVRAGTAQLAAGELETKLPVDGHDEIAGLAEDFNRMAQTLKEAATREREVEQARRDLIAAISHDLRTPLAAAQALIEAVVDGITTDQDTQDRYLRSAHNEVTHLSRLVDDLFELAQIDAGMLKLDLQEASLHDLISDTLSSFQPQAEQLGVRLVGEVLGGVDPVLMNPPKVQRVLYNLISNALRHTPAGGTIALKAEPQGPTAQVEIVDTGSGIDPKDLPHVFERWFRGDRSRPPYREEGTSNAGLGLSIARGLIEAHGGTIDAHSALGSGSRFRFTLQRA